MTGNTSFYCCCSVTKFCPTPLDPMDCSTPGFPVPHISRSLPKFSTSPSNEYLGLISLRMDWLDLLAVQGTLEESSPTPQFKSINSSALSFFYSPTLTSIHDHWKSHSLDYMDLCLKSRCLYFLTRCLGS